MGICGIAQEGREATDRRGRNPRKMWIRSIREKDFPVFPKGDTDKHGIV